MKRLKIAIGSTAVLGILLGIGSFILLAANKDSFAGNLLLNIVAECVGFAGGAAIGVWVAVSLAEDKLTRVAPHLVRLIRQLREDDTITGQAARECVGCAVLALSEKPFRDWRDAAPGSHYPTPCGVCALTFEADSAADGVRCLRCGLPAETWSDELFADRTDAQD